MKAIFLGTGTSVGVPVIGCTCEVCRSDNPKNDRTRSSLYLEHGQQAFVIDTSVDFRRQCIREGIDHLDFILFTHAHADHIGGLDDVRPMTYDRDQPLPAYGNPQTLERIRTRFDYIFTTTPNNSWKPEVELREITEPHVIEGVAVEPLPVWHGELKIHGYRFGDLAYLSDVSEIPQETLEQLEQLDVLILDGLREQPHPTHLTIDAAIELARTIEPRQTYLTHMTHEIDYPTYADRLPDDIQPAYDGLTITL